MRYSYKALMVPSLSHAHGTVSEPLLLLFLLPGTLISP